MPIKMFSIPVENNGLWKILPLFLTEAIYVRAFVIQQSTDDCFNSATTRKVSSTTEKWKQVEKGKWKPTYI